MAEEETRTVKEKIREVLLSRRFNMFLRMMGLIARFVLVICLCAVIIMMMPYVAGEQEFEEIPLSLSQLEAILCVIFLFYVMKKMP